MSSVEPRHEGHGCAIGPRRPVLSCHAQGIAWQSGRPGSLSPAFSQSGLDADTSRRGSQRDRDDAFPRRSHPPHALWEEPGGISPTARMRRDAASSWACSKLQQERRNALLLLLFPRPRGKPASRAFRSWSLPHPQSRWERRLSLDFRTVTESKKKSGSSSASATRSRLPENSDQPSPLW